MAKMTRKDESFKTGSLYIITMLLVWLALIPTSAACEADSFSYEGFSFTVNGEGKAVIISYSGEETDLRIPEYCAKYPTAEVREIGVSADIESITIPDSVNVAERALNLCFSLSEIIVSDTHPDLKAVDNVLFSKDGKMLICYPSEKNGEAYVIPEGTETIGDSAFWDCPFLREVSIPSSVKNIGAGAFGYCSELTEIDIPASVMRIGPMAFANSAVTKLDLSKNTGLMEISDEMAYNCWQLSQIILPGSITRIGDEAFAFSVLSEVVLPAGVNEIGINPFWGCMNLHSISFESASRSFFVDYPFLVETETSRAISCIPANAENIQIPDTVSIIGDYCCSYCDNLAEVRVPGHVKLIGQYAFSCCTALRSVQIGLVDTLMIMDHAFEECYELSSLTISGIVSDIGPDAFKGTDALQAVISACQIVKDYFELHGIQVMSTIPAD